MTGGEGLVSPEGVDEGSADSTVEGPLSGAGGDADLLGEAPRGAPVDEAQAAAPDDWEQADTREAREQMPGQQYSVGEGGSGG
ncbi:MAG: hypothetical protein M3P46_08445 [Actinomycetota bacterium]|nr:hypothetical protein [Actinomycetota bacterium]